MLCNVMLCYVILCYVLLTFEMIFHIIICRIISPSVQIASSYFDSIGITNDENQAVQYRPQCS